MYDIKTGIVSEIAQKIFEFLDPKRSDSHKKNRARPYTGPDQSNSVIWGEEAGPRMAKEQYKPPPPPSSPRHKSRNDGHVFESADLDCIYKFTYQVQILGKHPKQVDETCFPVRFQKENNELGYFMKKDFIRTNIERYRILKSTDPGSFYSKMG